jgi:hypothetical protein
MKLHRLKNDTRWNYGIRITDDYATMGRVLQIFCFRQKRIPDLGECMNIYRGFWFDLRWFVRVEKWWSWSLKTRKTNAYKSPVEKRREKLDVRKAVHDKMQMPPEEIKNPLKRWRP